MHVDASLNAIVPLVEDPGHFSNWWGNSERLLKTNLIRRKLMPLVSRFERPMFTAASLNRTDPSRWGSSTNFPAEENVVVKYPVEYVEAKATCDRLLNKDH
jgi:hypothetical protein